MGSVPAMCTGIIALFIVSIPLVPSAASAEPVGAFQQPVIDVKNHPEGAEFTIRLIPEKSSPDRPHPVPFTTERFSLTVNPDGHEVRERDIFSTSLKLDLNGDGDTDDSFKVSCTKRGAMRIGRKVIKPIRRSPNVSPWTAKYPTAGELKRAQPWGGGGASILLYERCVKGQLTTLGLQPAGDRLAVHTMRGPTLQVMVAQVVATPGTAKQFELAEVTLDGLNPEPIAIHQAHSFERHGVGAGKWLGFQWLMLPLTAEAGTQTFRAILKTQQTEAKHFIVAMVNESPKRGVRQRTASHAVQF